MRTGQPRADPTAHTCIPHFAPTPWLFESCSSPSPSKRITSSSFHRPQLLPHVCCSLKYAKQAVDVQASSQRHCSNVSFFCIRQVSAPTHAHLNSAPPALEFNLHMSSLNCNGFSYAKGKNPLIAWPTALYYARIWAAAASVLSVCPSPRTILPF